MTRANYSMTTGLTLNENYVVCVKAEYETEHKSMVIFLTRDYKVLNAQGGELWFKPLPLEGSKFNLSVSLVMEFAQWWARKEKHLVNSVHPDVRDYDTIWGLNHIITFNNDEDLIASYEHRMEQEAIMEKKYLREQAIHEEWLQYPRISKKYSRKPLDLENLPLEIKKEILPLIVAYKGTASIHYILVEQHPEVVGCLSYKHIYKLPTNIPIVRGWWEEGKGYSGGHTSQAGFECTCPEPNKDTSYYYDTSWEGSTSGCYPSMLSF